MRLTAPHPLASLALAALLIATPASARHGSHAVNNKREPSYAGRAEIRSFAAETAAAQGLDRRWLATQLARAHRIEAVRKLIMPPAVATAKNWAAYRERFIEPQRIAAGLAFWQDNADWLAQAEERFGVPAEVVVGIVGVETYYGRITGNFRVIDALSTLAFDFPAGRSDRRAFFRQELAEFFVLCAREGVDPQTVKGSFAGAIGWPQFMPGSINRHALDFDGDGHVDLYRSRADIVGSVAQYLQRAGWQRGLPARYEVVPPADAENRAALLAPDIAPSFSATQMADKGAALSDDGRAHEGPLALVELHNGEQPPSYVAGTVNFRALTRYNASSYYAMAVIELGQAVAAAKAARPVTPP
ncbi:Membrane-bound lytic murein transglycosylase B precursor [Rubrivivax sp. A210]|uniref:lytic murein transglycosylase B n=1 Tax=Rubrivivax sp. A210 TaxID=2772301 RepID=UPI00199E3BB3|nr:lytic murein transglycosylase B [Rubrivivax sp. A210]CAD5374604.1 Membrane-bound lytic murein transglycosylase B precursor [Rubrivivax sp. A210]